MSTDAALEQTLRSGPPHVRRQLAALYRLQGRVDDELEVLRSLATDADGRFDYGCALLSLGRYAEGWPLFDERYNISRLPGARLKLNIPDWSGERVDRLLIYHDGGFGNVIQNARFFAPIRERGTAVTFLCQPELADLVAPLVDRLLIARGAVSVGDQDAYATLGSVPGLLRCTLENIPPTPYLAAPARATAARVGVVPRGNPKYRHDSIRSLPSDLAERLLAMPGAMSLDPAVTGAANFFETAQIIMGLDLVVAVDTAVAHLAGALGKPVWIMLPTEWTDWRWLRDRSDSPWYASARLFRQDQPGDWRSVVEAVAAEWPQAHGLR